MTDCSSTDIRDLLPDLVAGTLPAAVLEKVNAHVATCAACAEELALIRVVRSMRPQPVSINVSAIAARLNAKSDGESSLSSAPGTVRSIASARSRKRTMRYSSWSWAAAITLMAVGGLSVVIARRGQSGIMPGASVDTLLQGERTEATAQGGRTVETTQPGAPRLSATRLTPLPEPAALSVGELSEYSDSELEAVLKKLESWDGTASTDPVLPVPLVKPSGSTP